MAPLPRAIPHHLHLPAGTAHTRRTPTLVAMATANGIAQFPTAAIAVALPTIHSDLDASTSQLQWTITAFTLAMSAFLIASGRLADSFGRRRVLFAGTGVFVAGSVLAAAAPNAAVLIAGCALTGLGAAGMIPTSLAVIVASYPPDQRGLPIGVWGAASAVSSAVGPLLGGALTGAIGWPAIFGFGAVVAGGLVAVALWATAESNDPQAEHRIDGTGLALAAASMTTLSLAVIQAPTWGLTSVTTLVLGAVALVLLVLFLVVERRAPAPLVDLSFFRSRNFSGATIVLFVLNFTLITALFFLPLQLQELLGSSVTEAGVQLLPLMGLMVVTLPVGGPLAERTGPLLPIVVGVAGMAGGMVWLSSADAGVTYGGLWPAMALVGAGTGLALTPMNLAAMNAIPSRQSGAAGGVFTTLSGLGVSFGVAVGGAVFNAVQLSRTESLAGDAGVSVDGATAQSLDGLLSGAPGASQTLATFPSSQQAALTTAVREAFADGLARAYQLGAVVALVGLVLALALVRARPPADDDVPTDVAGAPPTA